MFFSTFSLYFSVSRRIEEDWWWCLLLWLLGTLVALKALCLSHYLWYFFILLVTFFILKSSLGRFIWLLFVEIVQFWAWVIERKGSSIWEVFNVVILQLVRTYSFVRYLYWGTRTCEVLDRLRFDYVDLLTILFMYFLLFSIFCKYDFNYFVPTEW